jgi:hypothetical protein
MIMTNTEGFLVNTQQINFCARVAQPNTSKTDLMPEVLHIVEWNEGHELKYVKVMASDPISAIDKVVAPFDNNKASNNVPERISFLES